MFNRKALQEEQPKQKSKSTSRSSTTTTTPARTTTKSNRSKSPARKTAVVLSDDSVSEDDSKSRKQTLTRQSIVLRSNTPKKPPTTAVLDSDIVEILSSSDDDIKPQPVRSKPLQLHQTQLQQQTPQPQFQKEQTRLVEPQIQPQSPKKRLLPDISQEIRVPQGAVYTEDDDLFHDEVVVISTTTPFVTIPHDSQKPLIPTIIINTDDSTITHPLPNTRPSKPAQSDIVITMNDDDNIIIDPIGDHRNMTPIQIASTSITTATTTTTPIQTTTIPITITTPIPSNHSTPRKSHHPLFQHLPRSTPSKLIKDPNLVPVKEHYPDLSLLVDQITKPKTNLLTKIPILVDITTGFESVESFRPLKVISLDLDTHDDKENKENDENDRPLKRSRAQQNPNNTTVELISINKTTDTINPTSDTEIFYKLSNLKRYTAIQLPSSYITTLNQPHHPIDFLFSSSSSRYSFSKQYSKQHTHTLPRSRPVLPHRPIYLLNPLLLAPEQSFIHAVNIASIPNHYQNNLVEHFFKALSSSRYGKELPSIPDFQSVLSQMHSYAQLVTNIDSLSRASGQLTWDNERNNPANREAMKNQFFFGNKNKKKEVISLNTTHMYGDIFSQLAAISHNLGFYDWYSRPQLYKGNLSMVNWYNDVPYLDRGNALEDQMGPNDPFTYFLNTLLQTQQNYSEQLNVNNPDSYLGEEDLLVNPQSTTNLLVLLRHFNLLRKQDLDGLPILSTLVDLYDEANNTTWPDIEYQGVEYGPVNSENNEIRFDPNGVGETTTMVESSSKHSFLAQVESISQSHTPNRVITTTTTTEEAATTTTASTNDDEMIQDYNNIEDNINIGTQQDDVMIEDNTNNDQQYDNFYQPQPPLLFSQPPVIEQEYTPSNTHYDPNDFFNDIYIPIARTVNRMINYFVLQYDEEEEKNQINPSKFPFDKLTNVFPNLLKGSFPVPAITPKNLWKISTSNVIAQFPALFSIQSHLTSSHHSSLPQSILRHYEVGNDAAGQLVLQSSLECKPEHQIVDRNFYYQSLYAQSQGIYAPTLASPLEYPFVEDFTDDNGNITAMLPVPNFSAIASAHDPSPGDQFAHPPEPQLNPMKFKHNGIHSFINSNPYAFIEHLSKVTPRLDNDVKKNILSSNINTTAFAVPTSSQPNSTSMPIQLTDLDSFATTVPVTYTSQLEPNPPALRLLIRVRRKKIKSISTLPLRESIPSLNQNKSNSSGDARQLVVEPTPKMDHKDVEESSPHHLLPSQHQTTPLPFHLTSYLLPYTLQYRIEHSSSSLLPLRSLVRNAGWITKALTGQWHPCIQIPRFSEYLLDLYKTHHNNLLYEAWYYKRPVISFQLMGIVVSQHVMVPNHTNENLTVGGIDQCGFDVVELNQSSEITPSMTLDSESQTKPSPIDLVPKQCSNPIQDMFTSESNAFGFNPQDNIKKDQPPHNTTVNDINTTNDNSTDIDDLFNDTEFLDSLEAEFDEIFDNQAKQFTQPSLLEQLRPFAIPTMIFPSSSSSSSTQQRPPEHTDFINDANNLSREEIQELHIGPVQLAAMAMSPEGVLPSDSSNTSTTSAKPSIFSPVESLSSSTISTTTTTTTTTIMDSNDTPLAFPSPTVPNELEDILQSNPDLMKKFGVLLQSSKLLSLSLPSSLPLPLLRILSITQPHITASFPPDLLYGIEREDMNAANGFGQEDVLQCKRKAALFDYQRQQFGGQLTLHPTVHDLGNILMGLCHAPGFDLLVDDLLNITNQKIKDDNVDDESDEKNGMMKAHLTILESFSNTIKITNNPHDPSLSHIKPILHQSDLPQPSPSFNAVEDETRNDYLLHYTEPVSTSRKNYFQTLLEFFNIPTIIDAIPKLSKQPVTPPNKPTSRIEAIRQHLVYTTPRTWSEILSRLFFLSHNLLQYTPWIRFPSLSSHELIRAGHRLLYNNMNYTIGQLDQQHTTIKLTFFQDLLAISHNRDQSRSKIIHTPVQHQHLVQLTKRIAISMTTGKLPQLIAQIQLDGDNTTLGDDYYNGSVTNDPYQDDQYYDNDPHDLVTSSDDEFNDEIDDLHDNYSHNPNIPLHPLLDPSLSTQLHAHLDLPLLESNDPWLRRIVQSLLTVEYQMTWPHVHFSIDLGEFKEQIEKQKVNDLVLYPQVLLESFHSKSSTALSHENSLPTSPNPEVTRRLATSLQNDPFDGWCTPLPLVTNSIVPGVGNELYRPHSNDLPPSTDLPELIHNPKHSVVYSYVITTDHDPELTYLNPIHASILGTTYTENVWINELYDIEKLISMKNNSNRNPTVNKDGNNNNNMNLLTHNENAESKNNFEDDHQEGDDVSSSALVTNNGVPYPKWKRPNKEVRRNTKKSKHSNKENKDNQEVQSGIDEDDINKTNTNIHDAFEEVKKREELLKNMVSERAEDKSLPATQRFTTTMTDADIARFFFDSSSDNEDPTGSSSKSLKSDKLSVGTDDEEDESAHEVGQKEKKLGLKHRKVKGRNKKHIQSTSPLDQSTPSFAALPLNDQVFVSLDNNSISLDNDPKVDGLIKSDQDDLGDITSEPFHPIAAAVQSSQTLSTLLHIQTIANILANECTELFISYFPLESFRCCTACCHEDVCCERGLVLLLQSILNTYKDHTTLDIPPHINPLLATVARHSGPFGVGFSSTQPSIPSTTSDSSNSQQQQSTPFKLLIHVITCSYYSSIFSYLLDINRVNYPQQSIETTTGSLLRSNPSSFTPQIPSYLLHEPLQFPPVNPLHDILFQTITLTTYKILQFSKAEMKPFIINYPDQLNPFVIPNQRLVHLKPGEIYRPLWQTQFLPLLSTQSLSLLTKYDNTPLQFIEFQPNDDLTSFLKSFVGIQLNEKLKPSHDNVLLPNDTPQVSAKDTDIDNTPGFSTLTGLLGDVTTLRLDNMNCTTVTESTTDVGAMTTDAGDMTDAIGIGGFLNQMSANGQDNDHLESDPEGRNSASSQPVNNSHVVNDTMGDNTSTEGVGRRSPLDRSEGDDEDSSAHSKEDLLIINHFNPSLSYHRAGIPHLNTTTGELLDTDTPGLTNLTPSLQPSRLLGPVILNKEKFHQDYQYYPYPSSVAQYLTVGSGHLDNDLFSDDESSNDLDLGLGNDGDKKTNTSKNTTQINHHTLGQWFPIHLLLIIQLISTDVSKPFNELPVWLHRQTNPFAMNPYWDPDVAQHSSFSLNFNSLSYELNATSTNPNSCQLALKYRNSKSKPLYVHPPKPTLYYLMLSTAVSGQTNLLSSLSLFPGQYTPQNAHLDLYSSVLTQYNALLRACLFTSHQRHHIGLIVSILGQFIQVPTATFTDLVTVLRGRAAVSSSSSSCASPLHLPNTKQSLLMNDNELPTVQSIIPTPITANIIDFGATFFTKHDILSYRRLFFIIGLLTYSSGPMITLISRPDLIYTSFYSAPTSTVVQDHLTLLTSTTIPNPNPPPIYFNRSRNTLAPFQFSSPSLSLSSHQSELDSIVPLGSIEVIKLMKAMPNSIQLFVFLHKLTNFHLDLMTSYSYTGLYSSHKTTLAFDSYCSLHAPVVAVQAKRAVKPVVVTSAVFNPIIFQLPSNHIVFPNRFLWLPYNSNVTALLKRCNGVYCLKSIMRSKSAINRTKFLPTLSLQTPHLSSHQQHHQFTSTQIRLPIAITPSLPRVSKLLSSLLTTISAPTFHPSPLQTILTMFIFTITPYLKFIPRYNMFDQGGPSCNNSETTTTTTPLSKLSTTKNSSKNTLTILHPLTPTSNPSIQMLHTPISVTIPYISLPSTLSSPEVKIPVYQREQVSLTHDHHTIRMGDDDADGEDYDANITPRYRFQHRHFSSTPTSNQTSIFLIDKQIQTSIWYSLLRLSFGITLCPQHLLDATISILEDSQTQHQLGVIHLVNSFIATNQAKFNVRTPFQHNSPIYTFYFDNNANGMKKGDIDQVTLHRDQNDRPVLSYTQIHHIIELLLLSIYRQYVAIVLFNHLKLNPILMMGMDMMDVVINNADIYRLTNSLLMDDFNHAQKSKITPIPTVYQMTSPQLFTLESDDNLFDTSYDLSSTSFMSDINDPKDNNDDSLFSASESDELFGPMKKTPKNTKTTTTESMEAKDSFINMIMKCVDGYIARANGLDVPQSYLSPKLFLPTLNILYTIRHHFNTAHQYTVTSAPIPQHTDTIVLDDGDNDDDGDDDDVIINDKTPKPSHTIDITASNLFSFNPLTIHPALRAHLAIHLSPGLQLTLHRTDFQLTKASDLHFTFHPAHMTSPLLSSILTSPLAASIHFTAGSGWIATNAMRLLQLYLKQTFLASIFEFSPLNIHHILPKLFQISLHALQPELCSNVQLDPLKSPAGGVVDENEDYFTHSIGILEQISYPTPSHLLAHFPPQYDTLPTQVIHNHYVHNKTEVAVFNITELYPLEKHLNSVRAQTPKVTDLQPTLSNYLYYICKYRQVTEKKTKLRRINFDDDDDYNLDDDNDDDLSESDSDKHKKTKHKDTKEVIKLDDKINLPIIIPSSYNTPKTLSFDRSINLSIFKPSISGLVNDVELQTPLKFSQQQEPFFDQVFLPYLSPFLSLYTMSSGISNDASLKERALTPPTKKLITMEMIKLLYQTKYAHLSPSLPHISTHVNFVRLILTSAQYQANVNRNRATSNEMLMKPANHNSMAVLSHFYHVSFPFSPLLPQLLHFSPANVLSLSKSPISLARSNPSVTKASSNRTKKMNANQQDDGNHDNGNDEEQVEDKIDPNIIHELFNLLQQTQYPILSPTHVTSILSSCSGISASLFPDQISVQTTSTFLNLLFFAFFAKDFPSLIALYCPQAIESIQDNVSLSSISNNNSTVKMESNAVTPFEIQFNLTSISTTPLAPLVIFHNISLICSIFNISPATILPTLYSPIRWYYQVRTNYRQHRQMVREDRREKIVQYQIEMIRQKSHSLVQSSSSDNQPSTPTTTTSITTASDDYASNITLLAAMKRARNEETLASNQRVVNAGDALRRPKLTKKTTITTTTTPPSENPSTDPLEPTPIGFLDRYQRDYTRDGHLYDGESSKGTVTTKQSAPNQLFAHLFKAMAQGNEEDEESQLHQILAKRKHLDDVVGQVNVSVTNLLRALEKSQKVPILTRSAKPASSENTIIMVNGKKIPKLNPTRAFQNYCVKLSKYYVTLEAIEQLKASPLANPLLIASLEKETMAPPRAPKLAQAAPIPIISIFTTVLLQYRRFQSRCRTHATTPTRVYTRKYAPVFKPSLAKSAGIAPRSWFKPRNAYSAAPSRASKKNKVAVEQVDEDEDFYGMGLGYDDGNDERDDDSNDQRDDDEYNDEDFDMDHLRSFLGSSSLASASKKMKQPKPRGRPPKSASARAAKLAQFAQQTQEIKPTKQTKQSLPPIHTKRTQIIEEEDEEEGTSDDYDSTTESESSTDSSSDDDDDNDDDDDDDDTDNSDGDQPRRKRPTQSHLNEFGFPMSNVQSSLSAQHNRQLLQQTQQRQAHDSIHGIKSFGETRGRFGSQGNAHEDDDESSNDNEDGDIEDDDSDNQHSTISRKSNQFDYNNLTNDLNDDNDGDHNNVTKTVSFGPPSLQVFDKQLKTHTIPNSKSKQSNDIVQGSILDNNNNNNLLLDPTQVRPKAISMVSTATKTTQEDTTVRKRVFRAFMLPKPPQGGDDDDDDEDDE